MIPVITYLLCVYLVFKGVEIFQIAYMSNRDEQHRFYGIVIGMVAIGASITFAMLFAYWITSIAVDAGQTIPKLP